MEESKKERKEIKKSSSAEEVVRMELEWSHQSCCPCFSSKQLVAGVVVKEDGDLPRL